MTPASAASSPADGGGGPRPSSSSQSLPEVLKRLGRLEVRAARVVDGFLSGRHSSPFLGRSLEFREHRQYAAGDDLRHIDWKAWGRQDRLFVKQYEEENNLRATLLVDSSASMRFRGEGASGSPGDAMSKHEYAATAACVLAYLLTAQHDAVACRAFAGEVIAETPHRTGRAQVSAIADLLTASLEGSTDAAKTDLAGLLRSTAETIPRRGVVVLLSDLLCPLEGLDTGLAMLQAKGADMVVMQTLSDDEIDFPLEGATRFVGLEGGAELDANPRALRREYLAALAQHQDAIEAACARRGANHQLIRTSQSLESVLIALLSSRLRGPRRR
ncbi:hypothetical protein Pla108_31830 [Botrimarina colliarenosi]|uniref:DUF58 domain-containing protein n=1 Tax=Botrimarina colliarenosi TaxID=2528001 RepID=A0A5C6AAM8_9BACT|nr:DUF58 domain-containing protein [Botrimarina colliarenosi]TWT96101.1 hypothetical protein Pla108_31830 [Botrimarina colliarenosi]